MEDNREDDLAELIMDQPIKKLRPVFSGKTKDDQEITLYQHLDKPEELHILLPNEELWALNPGDTVSTFFDHASWEMRVDIISDIWTGQATGNRWMTLNAEAR